MTNLDDSNFMMYAEANYDNRQCFDSMEFYEDVVRFKYVKKLFKRYKTTGELKERLILNHLVIIYNVFGQPAATRMLFFKLQDYHESLKPFLAMLSFLPERVESVGGHNYWTEDIQIDQRVVSILTSRI